ncbi:MAG: Asp-tRNA(Asn)/Glu-tRNA(Gln) amidotransferase subunit GatA [SAR202 cluster bacterium]|nr:Asp-tRNA(Asn)/Glu-tRNA(Gln) amidotransferase subunit GatA [SAR202 cluster bacterium]|tara:strand:- start:9828 stop:11267 length:1440 start_codon:yes stop_codon:yes gene_type:complete
MSSSLTKLSINQANQLLLAKEVSSVELTQAYLEKIESIEPHLRALITVEPELALNQARAADKQISEGLATELTGIPMVIKDNICTKGIKTTCASKMLQDFIPPYNATVVDKLYNSGAVLLAKANLDEFAMGSSTENSSFHPTSNPVDYSRVPGGSSGGAAAAVAADECVFSIGSDTGGSIRQPASLCGTVGLKPTYGLVSRYGLVAFASSLDQIGPLTKTVDDSASVLSVLSGHDEKDSTSIKHNACYDVKSITEPAIKGLRVGIPKEYFVSGIEPSVNESVQSAIALFEKLGAKIEEVSLPHTKYALSVYYIIAPSEASANLARYDGVKYGYSSETSGTMWDALESTRGEGFGSEVKRRIMIGTYALSSGYYDAYYLKAQKVRTLISQEFNEVFKSYDILITPTSPTVAFKRGSKTSNPVEMYLSDVLTIPANIAGIPAISLPCGFDNGLPIGLQLMSAPLNESLLLKTAKSYEIASS